MMPKLDDIVLCDGRGHICLLLFLVIILERERARASRGKG